MVTKKQLTFWLTVLVIFSAIFASAYLFGVKISQYSTDSYVLYDLNRVFFLVGHLNQYAYTSFYFRAAILTYWFIASFLLTFLGFKIMRMFRKEEVSRGKKTKN